MEIEIVAKEVIKPSSPTTKTFNLSFLDKQYTCFYNKLVFFYQNNSGSITENLISERTRCLKSSLSTVLTRFYPLAGKLKDQFSVFTDEDDGAEFVEARVKGTLTEYLAEPKVDCFLPHLVSADYIESWTRPLLIVQASFFTCGGLAIGISISHRVSDAAAFTCFVSEWANTANENHESVIRPDFSGSVIFPPSDSFMGTDLLKELFPDRTGIPNVITRRFLFPASAIVGLQEKACMPGSQPPSRVQTISAFLWRIAMKMSRAKAGGSGKPSTLYQPMNLRRLLPLPICDQSFGNLIDTLVTSNSSGDIEIPYLVSLLRDELEKLRKGYENIKVHQGKKIFAPLGGLQSAADIKEMLAKMNSGSVFWCASWCRFPLYDTDFGWGKPTWIATYWPAPNRAVLMDASDGTSIEAWVCFCEEDMVLFASDEELLAYATLDPNIHGLVC